MTDCSIDALLHEASLDGSSRDEVLRELGRVLLRGGYVFPDGVSCGGYEDALLMHDMSAEWLHREASILRDRIDSHLEELRSLLGEGSLGRRTYLDNQLIKDCEGLRAVVYQVFESREGVFGFRAILDPRLMGVCLTGADPREVSDGDIRTLIRRVLEHYLRRLDRYLWRYPLPTYLSQWCDGDECDKRV